MRRVAVVTGASSGIGRATAKKLAEDGYAVLVTARRKELLDALVEEIISDGGEAVAVQGDISLHAHCEEIVRRAADWGQLEVFVANAGVGYSGPFELMADEEIRQLIDVNLLGVLRPIREAIPAMKEQGGKIVIIGSVLSRLSTPGNAVYCATKHALVGFADALRLEVGHLGIRIISVLPGYTYTEFFDAAIHRGERSIDTVKSFLPKTGIFSIFHSSEDVAEVISRRIRRPKAEVVVGAANTAIVFIGTRFPGFFRRALTLVGNMTR